MVLTTGRSFIRITSRRQVMAEPRMPHTPAGTGGEVRVHAQDVKEETKEKAREVTHEVKSRVRDAQQRIESTADEQKEVFADRIHAVARALHEAGETLEREEERDLARYGHEAADTIDRAAGYLERNDVRGMIRDLEDTARHSPAAVLGGSFAAGMALGRFLRASRPETDRPDSAMDGDGMARTADFGNPVQEVERG